MIVMDCSAVVSIIRGDENADALVSLIRPGEEIIAPAHLKAEALSAFWQFVRFGGEKVSNAIEQLESVSEIVDRFYDVEELAVEALIEGVNLKHSTYDVLYYILAKRTGATLFTLDRKLQQICLSNNVNCVHAEDLS